YLGDGGPANQAGVKQPAGIVVAPDGSYYIADSGHNRIRRVDANGIIATVAGTGVGGYSGDGGAASAALLFAPQGVALGPDGSLYIADTFNNRIRRVDTSGIITTVAGSGVLGFSGDGGPATQARLVQPDGVKVEIGRASCRERVEISEVGGSVKKKKETIEEKKNKE